MGSKSIETMPEPPEPPEGFAETEIVAEPKEGFLEKLFAKKKHELEQKALQQSKAQGLDVAVKKASKEPAAVVEHEIKPEDLSEKPGFFDKLLGLKPATESSKAPEIAFSPQKAKIALGKKPFVSVRPDKVTISTLPEIKDFEKKVHADLEDIQLLEINTTKKEIDLNQLTTLADAKKHIKRREKQLEHDVKELQRAYAQLLQHYKSLSKREDDVLKHEERLKKIRAEFEAKEIEVHMREEGVIRNEMVLKDNKALLDREELSLIKKISKLEKDQTELDEKEQEVINSIKRLEKEKEENIAFARELTKIKNELNDRELAIAPTEKKLQQFKGELDFREKQLQDSGRELTEQQKLLEKQEAAISGTVQKIEDDKELISQKENAIVKEITKFERLKEEIKDKARALTLKEQDADMKISLNNQRSKELNDLAKKLEHKEKQLETLAEEIKDFKKLLEHKKELERIVDRLQKRSRGIYNRIESPLIKEEHKNVVQKVVDVAEEIKAFMGKTQKLIDNKNYAEAHNNIDQLMNMYSHLDDSNLRKKEIYYDILSLKNQMKLALHTE
ncbi:hypothetical protein HYY69_04165 [Candidatus Woesearchaeota archaeon]|nr:hypothetical protein [Candidatus Woesearchaeota archaeon]